MGEVWTVQDEITAVWWRAYEQGRRDAQAELEAWAEDFAAQAPSAAPMPVSQRHAAVVRWLVDRMAREGRRVR